MARPDAYVGKAHYYRQEIGKAVEVLDKALELGESPKIRASLNKALSEVRADGGNKTRLLAHFIVSYDGGAMESTGRMVIDTMDRSYASLKSQLGFEPPERVVVILYTRRDYNDMGGPDWSAGLFDGKVRVPVRGLERLDEGIKTTLHHEFAHAFIVSVRPSHVRTTRKILDERVVYGVAGPGCQRSGRSSRMRFCGHPSASLRSTSVRYGRGGTSY